MKTGVVLTGGDAPAAEYVRYAASRADLIVAADSGFDLAVRLGIQPVAS